MDTVTLSVLKDEILRGVKAFRAFQDGYSALEVLEQLASIEAKLKISISSMEKTKEKMLNEAVQSVSEEIRLIREKSKKEMDDCEAEIAEVKKKISEETRSINKQKDLLAIEKEEAKKYADTIVKKAEKESEKMIVSSRNYASKIISDAQESIKQVKTETEKVTLALQIMKAEVNRLSDEKNTLELQLADLRTGKERALSAINDIMKG